MSNKVKARMLIPAPQKTKSHLEGLEGIAEGSILIIEGKQFVVDWLNKNGETYNFSVLRREAGLDEKEVILKTWYQLNESQIFNGGLTQTSVCTSSYSPSEAFKIASNKLKSLQLKNKQNPY